MEGEGFMQERLDRVFFGSAEWLLHFDKATVEHITRQASDHFLLLQDSNPLRNKTKARFIFENRWTKMQETEEMIKDVWDQQKIGSRMFKVQQKLKCCKQKFIKWRKEENGNSRKEIELIQRKMDSMQTRGGERDWD